MKLRNKKTGEIKECPMIRVSIDVCDLMHYEFPNSLAELNAEWEDYEPKEPLIKDVKARAIFKMWASNFKNMMIGNTFTFYVDKEYQSFMANLKPTSRYCSPDIAELDLNFDYGGLEDGKEYTFAELCGEEEE